MDAARYVDDGTASDTEPKPLRQERIERFIQDTTDADPKMKLVIAVLRVHDRKWGFLGGLGVAMFPELLEAIGEDGAAQGDDGVGAS